MPLSYATYTGNGSTTTFSVPFSYLLKSHVKLYYGLDVLAGTYTSLLVSGTDYTWPSDTQVQLTTAPTASQVLTIVRDTPDGQQLVDWQDGSNLIADDLNTADLQNLYVVQEQQDRNDLAATTSLAAKAAANTATANVAALTATQFNRDGSTAMTGNLNLDSHRIINVTDPSGAQDAATKNYVDTFVNQTANIANSAVTTAKIADSAVTSAKIADGTIAAADLASDSVVTAKILDANVTTAKLADSSVTTAKIADANVTTGKLVDAGVTTGKIADSSVTTAKVADSAVTTAKIADSNVTTAKIADSAVTSAKIADGTIVAGDLASDSVTTAKIVDANVTTAKLADGSVTNTKLADAELQELATMGSTTAAALADLTAAEVQVLDGATLSTAELNTLDGITADVTELNQLDGNTLTNSPSWVSTTQYPTAAAIDSRITARIDPIGGFEAIANEDSFPATAPPEGTVVSIANANGLAVNASGVGAGTRTGGGAVVINGFPAGFNSTSLDDGIGLLVVATSTAHTYDFHRVVAKNEDVRQLSSDINDFKARYRIGTTNPTTDNDPGDLFFNTGTNKMLVRNGANDAWEEVQSIGEFFINTISSSGGTGGGSATFNGTAFRFELSNPPTFAQQLIVSINGVVQKPNAGTAQPAEGFALDGADIIFSSAPPASSPFFIITLGSTVNIGTPSAGTVGTTQLADGGVTTAKIAADAINGTKIADDSIDSEHYVDGSIDTAHLADDAVTAAKLADTAVTPGSYTLSSITVDAQGRITAASSGSAASPDIITEGNSSAEVVDTGSDGHFKVTTEGTDALRVTAGQDVLFGTHTSSNFSTANRKVLDARGSDNTIIVLSRGTGVAGDAGYLQQTSTYLRLANQQTSGDLRFATQDTERLRITSDGTLQLRGGSPGIDFSQIQTNAAGMTSETLDSYEEGTFAPSINSGYTVSYDVANGRYVKIGALVAIWLDIDTSSFSGSSGDVYAYINGLPFTVKNSGWIDTGFSVGWIYGLVNNVDHCYADGGQTRLVLLGPNAGGSRTHWTPAQVWGTSGDRRISISGVYYTDS